MIFNDYEGNGEREPLVTPIISVLTYSILDIAAATAMRGFTWTVGAGIAITGLGLASIVGGYSMILLYDSIKWERE